MLDILLTIDIDADVFDQSMQDASSQNQKPSWKGAEKGVPLLMQLFDTYKSSDGSNCVATWFVRADNQTGYYYNNNAYLFDQFKNYWTSLLSNNHEIAWHPHLYKLEKEQWIQETSPSALEEQMRASLKSVKEKGWDIKSSRIGEAYFSNSIALLLPSLGILSDSTALPGRERKDETRSIDWLISPEKPYYPSQNDYRVSGEAQVKLLEVPFSMVEVLADYDSAPLKRYVDLSFWHRALKDGLDNVIQKDTILNTIVHPSSILPELSAKPHGLLSYSIDEVKKNLDFIIQTAKRKGIDYRFITLNQLHNKILNKQHD